MSALSCDKLSFYEDLVTAKINQFIDDLAQDPTKPFLSTWFNRIQELYLDIHFGQVDHPEYVRRFFSRAFDVIAGLTFGCPSSEVAAAAFCEAKEVKEYVQSRTADIIENKDKSTFIYWWNEVSVFDFAVFLCA